MNSTAEAASRETVTASDGAEIIAATTQVGPGTVWSTVTTASPAPEDVTARTEVWYPLDGCGPIVVKTTTCDVKSTPGTGAPGVVWLVRSDQTVAHVAESRMICCPDATELLDETRGNEGSRVNGTGLLGVVDEQLTALTTAATTVALAS